MKQKILSVDVNAVFPCKDELADELEIFTMPPAQLFVETRDDVLGWPGDEYEDWVKIMNDVLKENGPSFLKGTFFKNFLDAENIAALCAMLAVIDKEQNPETHRLFRNQLKRQIVVQARISFVPETIMIFEQLMLQTIHTLMNMKGVSSMTKRLTKNVTGAMIILNECKMLPHSKIREILDCLMCDFREVEQVFLERMSPNSITNSISEFVGILETIAESVDGNVEWEEEGHLVSEG